MNTDLSQSAFSFSHFLSRGACKLFANTVRSFCALAKENVDYVLFFLLMKQLKTLPQPFPFSWKNSLVTYKMKIK